MRTRYYLLLLVGALLVAAGVAVGVGAFEYRVTVTRTVDTAPNYVPYGDLSARDRRLVDRAIDGERAVVHSSGDLPGTRHRTGKVVVRRDGTDYLVARQAFFNWRTPFGLAALALWVAGFATGSEAVRRAQFPDRPVYWVRR